jgi:hypothetical protein
MIFTRRTRRLSAVALGATILGGAAAATFAANPASAAGIISAVTTVSCSVTGSSWCISGSNSSSGIGVIGTSKSGTGLRGSSTSQYGLKATSGSGTAILAQTTSGASAITATGSTALGNVGVSAYGGFGVSGTAAYSGGVGVYGTTSSGHGFGTYGTVTGDGIGAWGSSTSGRGVYGTATTGQGGEFNSDSGDGILGFGKISGLFAQGGTSGVLGSSDSGTGVDAESLGGRGLYAQNNSLQNATITGVNAQPSSAQPSSGLAAYFQGNTGVISSSDTVSFVGADLANNGATTFSVDHLGNVTYSGTLRNVAMITRGTAVKSFSAHSTEPTVEDTGTAQLVAGAAVVRLDPAFAASIEPTAAYRVFVTPNGDTRGLFVATKTAAGFVVRESQAGRSTVTFDYRIVATALGASGQRMAIVSPAAASAIAPLVARPIVRAPKIPARLPAPAAQPATP